MQKLTSSSDNYNAISELCVEIKGQPSTEGEQLLKIKDQDEWMTPIIRYLKEGWLPEDKTEVRKIQIRADHFVIIDDVLYKRDCSLLYLRCANTEEADYVLREIHRGNLWKSCWSKVFSKKDTQSRILLADFTEGCTRPHQSMQ